MTAVIILAVCTTIIVVGMVYLKIRDASLEELQDQKKGLVREVDMIKNENLVLEQQRIEVETDLEKLYEKAESVILKSTPDTAEQLVDEFKRRKRRRNRP